MKKIGITVILLAAAMTFTACGSDKKSAEGTTTSSSTEKQSAEGTTIGSTETESAVGATTGGSTESDQEPINIEDITWNVDEGIADGERYVLLEYTNHSKYEICGFEIDFIEKAGIPQEEKEKFYEEIQSKFSYSEDDMKELKEKPISMHAESERITGIDETNKDVNCYYFHGYYYLKNMEHYQLVEPDIITIKFIDNNEIKTEYYDVPSKKYSMEERTEVADQWTTSDLGTKAPKPDTKMIESGRDDENIYMFNAYGFTLDQFNSYVDECKKLGYTIDERSFDGFYSADNESGYNVYLNYNEDDCMMSGTIEAPEE